MRTIIRLCHHTRGADIPHLPAHSCSIMCKQSTQASLCVHYYKAAEREAVKHPGRRHTATCKCTFSSSAYARTIQAFPPVDDPV